MTINTPNKPVILLIAEAVTLAHFSRIITLAKALDSDRYQVVVASDPRYLSLSAPLDCTFYPIRSISTTAFTQALAGGKVLYSAKTLKSYVEEELALFEKVRPDLIIGDFRLSLAVSAPLYKTPYAAVVNAYWSSFANIRYLVPDLPITHILGVRLAQKLFDVIRPVAFALHARPLNKVRRYFGLPSLGSDLRETYTWGDYTLYADSPDIVPIKNLPANHHYLGPIFWSAYADFPEWWDCLPEDRPLIFVTLGSSGQADLLPVVLTALSALPVTVVAATAGKITLAEIPANTYVAEYLPMEVVVRRAKLVICNGGSLTTYQALASGIPVIGLCSNMDQLLNMNMMQRLGIGLSLRAKNLHSADLVVAITTILGNSAYSLAVIEIGRKLMQIDSSEHFRKFVATALESGKSA